MRSTLTAAAAVSAIIVGYADQSSAATSSAAPALTTSVGTESFSCGGATKSSSGHSSSDSLRITLQGNDPTQTYTAGSKFTVKFAAESKGADVITWKIADYKGTVHASGSIDVSAGATTASVSCSSTISGYFAVSAKLKNSGATEPQQGSRPEGFVAFGVLPNVADYVPAFNASLDTRRVGLVTQNDVIPGTQQEPMNENLGTSWIMTDRAMSLTEPNHAGQFNPANYGIDDAIKEGNLGRVVYMNGLPFWASTAPSPESGGSYPPKSFSYFQTYSAQVAQESVRLDKEYIHNEHTNYYQASWEPDPGPSTEWKGTDAQFVELYKATWEGVHSVDPNAKVIGPATQSLGICESWLERLAPLGFTKYLDAVSCHGYYIVGASSALPPEVGNLPVKIRNLRQTMNKLMKSGTQLLVTETGIGYPMGAHYAANYPTSAVLTEHAEAVVRTHLIMLGEGVDKSFVFYGSDFDSPVGFGTYFNLNVATEYASGNLEPKPTAMAVAAATRLVDGSRSIGALTNMPSGGYGYAFLLADGKHTMTAVWAHNSSFNASDSYELAVDSPGTSGKTVMFDTMGNPKTVDYSNGVVKVTISEMPIYVLSSNAEAAKSHALAPQGYSTTF